MSSKQQEPQQEPQQSQQQVPQQKQQQQRRRLRLERALEEQDSGKNPFRVMPKMRPPLRPLSDYRPDKVWRRFKHRTLIPLLVFLGIRSMAAIAWILSGSIDEYFRTLQAHIYQDCYDDMKDMGPRERAAYVKWSRSRIQSAIGVQEAEEMFSKLLRRLEWEDELQ